MNVVGEEGTQAPCQPAHRLDQLDSPLRRGGAGIGGGAQLGDLPPDVAKLVEVQAGRAQAKVSAPADPTTVLRPRDFPCVVKPQR
jgi:hypothetical protein